MSHPPSWWSCQACIHVKATCSVSLLYEVLQQQKTCSTSTLINILYSSRSHVRSWETSIPAMKETTGFLVPEALMKSAASSSAVPPISPIMMMPSVCTQHRPQNQATHAGLAKQASAIVSSAYKTALGYDVAGNIRAARSMHGNPYSA